jgi:DNA-binding PadR family transcriptional regulator
LFFGLGKRARDTKKIYRYLRYTKKIGLLEIDHVEEDKFLPAKYYRLTDKGRSLIDLFREPKKKLAPKQH